jgi:hypothetical protein
MSPDQFRDRIMARIERDQAIHASSLDEEIATFVACQAKPPMYSVDTGTGIITQMSDADWRQALEAETDAMMRKAAANLRKHQEKMMLEAFYGKEQAVLFPWQRAMAQKGGA